MLNKEETEFCSSLEKMFNYLKTKKELTESEQQVIINFDYITRKVLSDDCKTATEIIAKNMYYELVKRKEECYEKQIDKLEAEKQKLIEKLEEKIKELEEKLKKQHGRVNEVTCFTEGELYQLKEILSMIKEREVK